MVPGFVDAHVHPVMAGVERLACDLSGSTTAAQTVAAIQGYARRRPQVPWVLGGGWLKEAFPGGEPGRHLLDDAFPDRPVMLRDNSHHSVWVNAEALRRSGLPPDVGPVLHEADMDLVAQHAPPSTEAERVAGLLEAQRHLHAVGVTGWQDAILGDYAGHPDPTGAYLAALAAGALTARVVGALWWPRGVELGEVDAVVAELAGRRAAVAAVAEELRSDRFRATAVKVMQDGVVESRTAGLTEPYVAQPQPTEPGPGCRCAGPAATAAAAHRSPADGDGDGGGQYGLSYVPADLLRHVAVALSRKSFQLHLHAIGDRAVREVLDALAAATGDPQAAPDLRHHVAHLQIVDPRDVPRFADVGATANLQALWACHEPAMDELNIPLIGQRRAMWQYPFGDLARSGARLAMGSDWPVSSPNPLAAIQVAVTRCAPGADAPPLLPDQALDVRAALSAYTQGSAWVNHDDDAGRLAPGYRADLAVLDQDVTDPRVVPAHRIADVQVDLTVVSGDPVFTRS
ncbi:MAG: amidohydrolase [Angustibacter sp.]